MKQINRFSFRNIFIFFFLIFVSLNSIAQGNETFNAYDISIHPSPSKVIDGSEKRNIPSAIIKWNGDFLECIDGKYSFLIESPVSFSYFGIGWKTEKSDLSPTDFTIFYRTSNYRIIDEEWKEVKGWIAPNESPSEMYRSDIIFVTDSLPHKYCEIILIPPSGTKIEQVIIDLVNLQSEIDPTHNEKSVRSNDLIEGCPIPVIIPRTEWCGGFAGCQTPEYSPEIINPTHVVLHHGGSPDTYIDGYTVVRGYWDYHVNSLGWDDIGYNFLIDKKGNLFQGRYNTEIGLQDVKGAHAGSVNSKAIGICFIGNTDVTSATPEQLSKLEELLSWWYNKKGIDPTSKVLVINQAGTDTLYLPRLVGHRDVKPATICPGENLYAILPVIREETKQKIQLCSGIFATNDFLIDDFTVSPSNVKAGKYINFSCSHSFSGNIESRPEETSAVGIWLSADIIFNPTDDILLGEYRDESLGHGKQNSLISDSIAIDQNTSEGTYYVFFISDLKNEFYETNEVNNEKYVSITINENSSVIYASVNPQNGGVINGAGKYKNGNDCIISATSGFGYVFAGWYENDILISIDPTYNFTVNGERNLLAVYECADVTADVFIQGDFDVCRGEKEIMYTVPDITNGLSYIWKLPDGTEGKEMNNSVFVDFNERSKSGNISLTVDIGCKNKVELTNEINVYDAPERPMVMLYNGVLISDSKEGNQWFINSEEINGAGSFIYKPERSGEYYTILSNSYCSSVRSNKIYFDLEEFMSAEDNNAMRIFPNPANDFIGILLSDYPGEESKIELFNINGVKVISRTSIAGQLYIEVDISRLISGIYFIEFYNGKDAFSGKIIKK